MMIVQSLHNPILGGGILLIAVSLYLQLTLQRRLDRLETRFKDNRLNSEQLDRWTFWARWLPVIFTVLGVVLLIWGFNEALEAAEAAELQGANSR
ncbi:hypothetical protein AXK12_05585 [Cephaloticoccus capnophilus]|uniref:Aerotolerance regulator N-terminal domain-containing protein n=1 Tax=Cephaloticoccus capnophilus TaxID=1548208 RepID=A0A139SL81_9BACT|nr:hypothetical protein [Cephaloticoccus capnophilus]KXU35319.1 hypothetical protein AXK12_05585 [Cephaloticoccus capnophilus]